MSGLNARSGWVLALVGVVVVLAAGVARAEVIADSYVEFSNVQGQDNWYQGGHSVDLNGDYDANPGGTDDFIALPDYWSPTGTGTHDGVWGGVGGNTQLWADWVHPTAPVPEHWVIRRWVSEVDSPVAIDWSFSKQNPDCGNGVTGTLLHNGQVIDTETIVFNDTVGIDRTVVLSVQQGDFLDFALSANGTHANDPGGVLNDWCDASYVFAVVNRVPEPSSVVLLVLAAAGLLVTRVRR